MKRLAFSMALAMAIPTIGQVARTLEKPIGASQSAQKVVGDAPSLADTEKWISNTFADNSGMLTCSEFDSNNPGAEYGMEYGCFKDSYSLDFAGCNVTFYTFNSHEGYLLTHDPVAYSEDGKERNSIAKFNLGNIDPKTIQAGDVWGAFGPLDKKKFHANPAQTNITLATTDSNDTITIEFPYASRPFTAKTNKLGGSYGFITTSPEYAPRFVKALTHAVELCGGKASAF
jgi:hypothetical protein